ncbi:MAG: ABC-2 family transporter protein [Anaerococcus sp.]|nr:ABC-2 family transporter protein [Anaerococcus sp.]MDD7045427.1 ABC-2 family transporter protein [Peptoniphilaceae bacterium]MDY2918945.1 ABC-2 family transporter protein [Anaerococcus sp.]
MKLNKYIRLYKSMFKLNIKSLMAYNFDFIIGIIAMLVKTLINFSILLILFSLVSDIKGRTFNEMLFLYGFSTASFGIWHSFFINTLTIPYYIKTGEFDRFLTKPCNPLFLILIDGFDDDGRSQLILGIVISLIAIVRLELFTPLLLLLPFLRIITSFIYAGISILLSTISFFTINNSDITNFTIQINEFAKYPLSIYNDFFRFIFTVILPIGFASYYPSLIYLRGYTVFNIGSLLFTVFYSLIFFALSIFIWMKCLKRYTSSGF